jgi:hypothetical protein
MRLRWVNRAEKRIVNELFDRRAELAVEEGALNPGSHLWPGIYWLVDAKPVGGWKGNEWAILWTDFSKSMGNWYKTREEAEVDWQELRTEEAKQGRETDPEQ